MSGFYILDEHGEPRAVADFLVWAAWFETAGNRVVKQDYAEGEDATCGVSTVFLGLDHNHAGIGPPILWETLVFGTSLDGEMRRYSSKAAAIRGHEELLKRVTELYYVEGRRG